MKGNKRKTGTEQYYTLPSVVDLCVSASLPYISKDIVLLEPCAGTGEFLQGFERARLTNSVLAFDIDPKYKGVVKQDFLTCKVHETCFTLTNPPFGRASSLAIKMFNHAAQCSQYIGFLIPLAWRKWSVQNRLNRKFHLIKDIDMPLTSFYNGDTGKPFTNGNLKTVFQLWEKRENDRELFSVVESGEIKKATINDANVALTVFGYSCGKVETAFNRVPNSTKMFIKASVKGLKALQAADFKQFSKNVSYIESLSWMEINAAVNQQLASITDES